MKALLSLSSSPTVKMQCLISCSYCRVPRDKKGLYKRYNNRTAVPFHARYAGDAHMIDGLESWFAYSAIARHPSIDRIIP